MPQPVPKQSTLNLSRKQGESLHFETESGEKLVIEFKTCKHLRTEVVLKMDSSVRVMRGEMLSSDGSK